MNYNDAIFSPDKLYRYVLSRKIEDSPPSERRLLAVMLNPSKAGGTVNGKVMNDLTITKCMGFAKKWGFGHLRVVNLYALVSTDPSVLLSHSDPIGSENDSYIDHNARWADDVWLAWGFNYLLAAKKGEERVDYVKRLIRAAHKPTFHLGLTATGQPKHPSRLPYDTHRVMEH